MLNGNFTVNRWLKRGAGAVLDAVLPPRCLKCGEIVESQGALCAGCWSGLNFLSPPCCACCGYPFEFDLGVGALCGACSVSRPVFERARAVFRYDDASRDLILSFKHADRTDGAPAFAQWLARAGADLIAEADLIVPVPLHWSRLFSRRFNQAALLAFALGKRTNKPVEALALKRRRATETQGHKGRLARFRNIKGAIAADPRRAVAVRGKRVLLIDDVVTTGATASACTKALLGAGAKAVDVLALAQVVRPM
jgi:ComF family protein